MKQDNWITEIEDRCQYCGDKIILYQNIYTGDLLDYDFFCDEYCCEEYEIEEEKQIIRIKKLERKFE